MTLVSIVSEGAEIAGSGVNIPQPPMLKMHIFGILFGVEGNGKLCALWNFLRLTSNLSLGQHNGRRLVKSCYLHRGETNELEEAAKFI